MAYTTLQDLQLAILERGNDVLLDKAVAGASDTDLIMASVLLEKMDRVAQLKATANINSAMVVLSKNVNESVTFLATIDNLTVWLSQPENVTQFNALINEPDIALAIAEQDTLLANIIASTTALNLVLASSVFMTALFSVSTATLSLLTVTTAMTAVLASTAAKTALSQASVGMTAAATNTTIMTSLTANQSFMALAANSTAAMTAIVGNSVAYTKLFANQTAMTEVAAVSSAMALIFNNATVYAAMLASTSAMPMVASVVANIETILGDVTLKTAYLASATAMSNSLSGGSTATAALLATNTDAITTLCSTSTYFGYVTSAPSASRLVMFSKPEFTNAIAASSTATSKLLSTTDTTVHADFVANTNAITSVINAGQTVTATYIGTSYFYNALFANSTAISLFIQSLTAMDKLLVNSTARNAFFSSSTAQTALMNNMTALEYVVTSGYLTGTGSLTGNYSYTYPAIEASQPAIDFLTANTTFVNAFNTALTTSWSIQTYPKFISGLCTSAIAASTFIPNASISVINSFLPEIFKSVEVTQALAARSILVGEIASTAAIVNTLIANQTAVDIFASNTTALTTLLNSTTARPLIVASAQTMKTIMSNATGSVTFAANSTAVGAVESYVNGQIGWLLAGTTKSVTSYTTVAQVVADSAAMTEIVASQYAVQSFVSSAIRTAIFANTSAITAIANSAVACARIANSNSTTFNAFLGNTTFASTVITNQAACDAIATAPSSGSTGMQYLFGMTSPTTPRTAWISNAIPMTAIAKSAVARVALLANSDAMTALASGTNSDQAKRILLLARSTKLYSDYPTLLDAATNTAAMTELVTSGDIENVFPFWQVMETIGSSNTALSFFINNLDLMKKLFASKGNRPSYNDTYVATTYLLNNSVGRLAVYNNDNALAALQANPLTIGWLVGNSSTVTGVSGVSVSSNSTNGYTFVANGTKVILLRLYTSAGGGNSPALCFARGYSGGVNNTTAGIIVPITGENLGRATGELKGHAFDYSDTGVPPTQNNDNANLVCAANGLRRDGGAVTTYVSYLVV